MKPIHMLKEANVKPKSGIYQIRNIKNGKVYIGSTNDLKKRKSGHFSNLEKNKHVNKHLQNAWNKYGFDSFVFEILEVVEENSQLIIREQHWIDKEKPEYNIRTIADRNEGILASEETKRKLSQVKVGELSHTAKLTWKEVREIREKYSSLKYTQQKLSEAYNVSRSTIKQIIENRNWVDENYVFKKRTAQEIKEIRKLSRAKREKTGVKLTKEQVQQIRELYSSGDYSAKELAKKYNIFGVSTIYGILHNRTWYDENYVFKKRTKEKIGEYFSEIQKGDKGWNSKLTKEQVEEIREMYKTCSQNELSKKYSLTRSAIQSIVLNRTHYDPTYKTIKKQIPGKND